MNKNRALLLDRDGVINIDTSYIGKVASFAFTPGLFPFLRSVRDLGYQLAILTNQSGVGRGYFSAQDYEEVSAHMLNGLREEKIEIDLVLACFAHPEGVMSDHKRESFWRKPNPGMVLETIRRLDLDPPHCAFLGDSLRDMEAGLAGGIGKCLWLTQDVTSPRLGIKIVHDFDQALKALSA